MQTVESYSGTILSNYVRGKGLVYRVKPHQPLKIPCNVLQRITAAVGEFVSLRTPPIQEREGREGTCHSSYLTKGKGSKFEIDYGRKNILEFEIYKALFINRDSLQCKVCSNTRQIYMFLINKHFMYMFTHKFILSIILSCCKGVTHRKKI